VQIKDFNKIIINLQSKLQNKEIFFFNYSQWAKSPKKSLKECDFLNTLLQTAFSAILPTGYRDAEEYFTCFLAV